MLADRPVLAVLHQVRGALIDNSGGFVGLDPVGDPPPAVAAVVLELAIGLLPETLKHVAFQHSSGTVSRRSPKEPSMATDHGKQVPLLVLSTTGPIRWEYLWIVLVRSEG